MSKIAIFGGTFDPVHKAHTQIAKLALQSFDLKKLIFVIAYAPPHKAKQYAGIEHRISMLQLASGNIKKTEINFYEFQKSQVVYSYQTLDHFQNLYPDDEIYMIIGSDSLVNLSEWKNINYLSHSYKFIVAKRPGIIINKNTKYLDKCIFINKDAADISSTGIRKLIKEDDKTAVSLLDKKVYDYIIQNKLYG